MSCCMIYAAYADSFKSCHMRIFLSTLIPYFTNIWRSVAHMSYNISRSLALPNGIYLNELQVCSAVQTLQTSFVLPRNFAPLNMPRQLASSLLG